MTDLLNLFRRHGDEDLEYLEEEASSKVMTRDEEFEFYGEGGTNDHLDEREEEDEIGEDS